MKRYLFLALVVWPWTVRADSTDTSVIVVDTHYTVAQGNWTAKPTDSVLALCKERGHVLSDVCTSTAAYCPPWTVDLPDKTIQIYWPCNTTTCTCKRCGVEYTLPVPPPCTTVIWQKPDTTEYWRQYLERGVREGWLAPDAQAMPYWDSLDANR